MTTRRERQKADLLAHYAQREPKAFYQIDGFAHGDDAGDEIWTTLTYELMTGIPSVRILVTAGTSEADVLRILRKMRKLVKSRGFGWFRHELTRKETWLDQTVCPTCGAPLADEQPDNPF